MGSGVPVVKIFRSLGVTLRSLDFTRSVMGVTKKLEQGSDMTEFMYRKVSDLQWFNSCFVFVFFFFFLIYHVVRAIHIL